MNIPPMLNAWALNVSQAYLSHYDPTTLHETDTLAFEWKKMPFMTRMDTDEQSEWIPVTRRRRSKSPPAPPTATGVAPEEVRRLGMLNSPTTETVALVETVTTPQIMQNSGKKKYPKKSRTQLSWSQGLPPVTTVNEDDEESDDEAHQKTCDTDLNSASKQSSHTQSSKLPPYQNISANDGTFRVNVKWHPPENTHAYEKDKKKLNEAIYDIVKVMVPPEVGIFYRWESEDLLMSKSVQELTATELREFISPAITFVHAQHQIIFGLRISFQVSPGVWMRSDIMKGFLTSKTLEVLVSNSKSTSGKMVTAGYVLLKAPNTTQLSRYTQFLRSVLPKNAPYFDVVRYKKTPMDQLIPHLRIQCGERHVTPLCQALLPVLTGQGSAMFIPRYALGTMTEEKIKGHFLFHETWARSLKAIPMSPHVNHLDQKRIEYNDDGTTTERSTREWASTILAPDNSSPALCDVVNGPPDHKAYLLVPSHYLQATQHAWRSYKARLYPPKHREARFRDLLPGLPDVIHIQAEIEAHVSFFEKLSEASVWKRADQGFIGYTSPNTIAGKGTDESLTENLSRSVASPAWPTPAEASLNDKDNSRSLSSNHKDHLYADHRHRLGCDTSTSTEDRSLASTRSLTNASKNSTNDTRFSELESQMQRKLQALEVSGKRSSERLLSMEQQFSRIDDLDKKLVAVTDKLALATEQMEKSNQTQQNISSDMEDMKAHTAQQFAEMNKRLLSNMEGQDKISTTMLDLREHFEKMSSFIESLANKMELDRKKAARKSPSQTTSIPRGHSVDASVESCTSRSTSNASTTSGSSIKSKSSVQSTASSTEYRSPEKKKQRSHGKHGTLPTIATHSDGISSDDFEECQSPEFMELCTNLDHDAFRSLDDPRHHTNIQRDDITQRDPTKSREVPSSDSPPLAPLDPQYNISTDLAGAANT
ncbi:hypothetical protein MHU86_8312 [Fragilaria crotonensis]|nr:hypothetical protein MHU86_8312 [Fragilaria crotonensis]